MTTPVLEIVRRQVPRLLALTTVAVAYALARPPELTSRQRERLAAPFRFARTPLPSLADTPSRSLRNVHPSLRPIEAWVSAVGASVALGDLDGDGLSNDVCHVDTRSDRVVVSPVPGTGDRFAAFALDADPLPYDRATMAPMGALHGRPERGRVDRHPGVLLGPHARRLPAKGGGGAYDGSSPR